LAAATLPFRIVTIVASGQPHVIGLSDRLGA
jgi:hypothetical protein